MHERPQADHCDLGLVDDDNTEDLRETAPELPVLAHQAGTAPNNSHLLKAGI